METFQLAPGLYVPTWARAQIVGEYLRNLSVASPGEIAQEIPLPWWDTSPARAMGLPEDHPEVELAGRMKHDVLLRYAVIGMLAQMMDTLTAGLSVPAHSIDLPALGGMMGIVGMLDNPLAKMAIFAPWTDQDGKLFSVKVEELEYPEVAHDVFGWHLAAANGKACHEWLELGLDTIGYMARDGGLHLLIKTGDGVVTNVASMLDMVERVETWARKHRVACVRVAMQIARQRGGAA